MRLVSGFVCKTDIAKLLVAWLYGNDNKYVPNEKAVSSSFIYPIFSESVSVTILQIPASLQSANMSLLC